MHKIAWRRRGTFLPGLAVVGMLALSSCAEATSPSASGAQGSPPPPPTSVSFSPQPNVNAPAAEAQFVMKGDAWYGNDSEGNYVEVWAGSDGGDSSQGELVILVLHPNGDGTYDTVSSNTYRTPEKVGAVSITSADGPDMTVETASGDTWIFDTSTDEFASSVSPSPSASTPSGSSGADSPTPSQSGPGNASLGG